MMMMTRLLLLTEEGTGREREKEGLCSLFRESTIETIVLRYICTQLRTKFKLELSSPSRTLHKEVLFRLIMTSLIVNLSLVNEGKSISLIKFSTQTNDTSSFLSFFLSFVPQDHFFFFKKKQLVRIR